MKKAAILVLFSGVFVNGEGKVENADFYQNLKKVEHDPEFGFTFDLGEDLKELREELLNSRSVYRDNTTASEPVASRRSMVNTTSTDTDSFKWSPSFVNITNSTMNNSSTSSTMNATGNTNNSTLNNATVSADGDIDVDVELVDTTVTPTNVPAPTIDNTTTDILRNSTTDIIDMVPSDFTINGNITAPPADHLQFTRTTTPYPTMNVNGTNTNVNGTVNETTMYRARFPQKDVDIPQGLDSMNDIIENLLYRGTGHPRNATMVHDFDDVSSYNSDAIDSGVNATTVSNSTKSNCHVSDANANTCHVIVSDDSDSLSDESNQDPIRDLLHEEKHRMVEEYPSTRSTIFDIECVGCNLNIMVFFLSAAVLLSSCISKDNLIRGPFASSKISK